MELDMKYKEFRNKYPKFIYHDYDIYEDDNNFLLNCITNIRNI